MIFRRKRNPETYPCLPSFLIAYTHCNDSNHYNDRNRPSGVNDLFRATEKGILPNNGFTMFFSPCHDVTFTLFIPCIPCTLARSDFSFAILTIHYPLAFLTFWHFESVQECKVCMGIITEFTSNPPMRVREFRKCQCAGNAKASIMAWHSRLNRENGLRPA